MTDTVTPLPASKKPGGFIVRNVTSSWAVLLVNTVVSFVLAPFVVNSLGSVYYGIWTLVMQFTGYLWLFDFGVRESVIKYVAQYHSSGDRQKLETTVRTAVSVYGLISLVAFLAVGGASVALPSLFNIPAEAVATAQLASFLAGATVAQSFLSNVFVGVLVGLQRIYAVSQIGVLVSLIRAVATYLLLARGYGLAGLAALHLLLSLANSVYLVYLCRVYLPDVSLRPIRPDRDDVRRLFNYGKYVLLANLGDKVVFASDAIVIATFLPVAQLTPYAVGGTLIGHMRSVVMAMASIFNPMSSRMKAESGEARLQAVVTTGAKAAMVVGLPFCIGFIALGELFITLWMGEQHAPMAGNLMTVLSLGYIAGMPYYTISGVLYGLNAHRTVAVLRLVEGALNLVLSVVLVNTIGLIGVALGTAVPHAIMVCWILPRTLPQVFPISLATYYRAVYGRTLPAAIPFLLSCWFIRTISPTSLLSFVAWGVLFLPLYVAPVWFFALSDEERRYLHEAIGVRRAALRPPSGDVISETPK